MCPIMSAKLGSLCFAVKVFLVIWIIFVPVVVTARLEKIIKLLEDQNRKK